MTSSTKKSKAEEVEEDQSESSIEQKNASGSSSESTKNKKKTKKTVEKEEKVKTFAYRVAYMKLPKKKPGEPDEVYYKRFFGTYNCSMSENERNQMYLKMLIRYKSENITQYVQRIDFLFDKCYPQMDIRTNCDIITMLNHYYRIKYAKESGESDEHWFERVLTKLPGETVKHYKDRAACLKITFTEVKWSTITIDAESSTGYKLKSASCSSSSQTKGVAKKTLTEEEVKKTYAKQEKEDIKTYFKRIVSKTSTSETAEEHIQEITLTRKCYPNLELWYDKKYISFITEYYTAIYAKRSGETNEQYYERMVTKETYESEEQCAKRVDMIRVLYPNLCLWTDEKLYIKFMKKIYTVVYGREKCEDETTYYNRICTQSEKESDTVYVGRMNLVQKTFRLLPLWYTEKYMNILSKYYKLKYAKGPNECDNDYYKRLIAKETYETNDAFYAQRIHIVHIVTVKISFWYDANFYEKYTKSYYLNFYKKGKKETCVAWLTRVIKQLTGESMENTINRIKLINKSKTGCKCWTSKYFKKLECSKTFTKEYLDKIFKAVKTSSVHIKKSSQCSTSKAASASESEDVTVIKRGKSR